MGFGCGFVSSAYEPLESQLLRTLTKKTLFLVSLATAKRVSEMQAVSRVVPRSGDDLILSFLLFFVAKTESPSNPLPQYFRLRSLKDFAHGLEEGSLLCPVKALSIYLQQTKVLLDDLPCCLFCSVALRGLSLRMCCRSFCERSSKILELSYLRRVQLGLTVFMVWQLRFPFCETERFPRCWRQQLGNLIRFLPLFT